MKTFIISIAVFLLITVNTFGQWVRHYSLENRLYYSVSFYGNLTGYVTSYPAQLLKTTDGGLSWFEINVPNTLNEIDHVEMTDENTVWIVMNRSPVMSSGGNISKSTDGGNTWEIVFETNYGIREFFILDEDHLWAGTDVRLVYRSTDGGETWAASEQLAMSTINDMYFINPETGWASGGDYRDLIEKTTDGGITWEVQFERYNSQGFGKMIEFVTDEKGFCVGFASLMLKTLNAGETWEFVSGSEEPGSLGILHGLPETYDIMDIDFINENRGWIVGRAGGCPQPPGHFIMSTKDGGDSWQMDMIDEYLPLGGMNRVDFNDFGKGWAVGDNGLLFIQDASVGVKPAPENSTLKIFPNPAQDYILINSDKDFGTMSLYNQVGQMLFQEVEVNSKEMKIDLSHYNSGVYFIEIDNIYYKVIKM